MSFVILKYLNNDVNKKKLSVIYLEIYFNYLN